MTYNVFSGTLNPTQSINQSINLNVPKSISIRLVTIGSLVPTTDQFSGLGKALSRACVCVRVRAKTFEQNDL